MQLVMKVEELKFGFHKFYLRFLYNLKPLVLKFVANKVDFCKKILMRFGKDLNSPETI